MARPDLPIRPFATGNSCRIAAQAETSGARADWHVTITIPPGGSVEHYHHFLTGFFAPLVYHLETRLAHPRCSRVLVRSCGPLDPIIRGFAGDRVEIIDRDRHREMASGASRPRQLSPGTHTLRYLTITGCDLPTTYDRRIFLKVRSRVLAHPAVCAEIGALADDWSCPRILLVERGASLAFYNSEQSEIKGSGRDRRSIANQCEVYKMLRQAFPGCGSIIAEDEGFARQVALFSLADCIIAQHGAALTNMIWARPGANIVEIYPVHQGLKHDFFFYLARCMGLRYRRVWQAQMHGVVDIYKVCRLVSKAIARTDHHLLTDLHAAAYNFLRPTLRSRLFIRRNSRRVARRIRRFILFLARRARGRPAVG